MPSFMIKAKNATVEQSFSFLAGSSFCCKSSKVQITYLQNRQNENPLYGFFNFMLLVFHRHMARSRGKEKCPHLGVPST